MTERARILFVDDEPHILQGLRRSMLEMDDQWEMVFCDGGIAALDELARQPADVVVSDMRMPCMDGAELLDQVRARYPATIRVILSGYADADSVLKTVGPAHVYLAKPCPPQTLRDAITKPLALRRLLADSGLRAALGEVSSLPSLPGLCIEIEHELRSPHASAASVAALLSKDVAMTAEILKLTNSAFFGLGAHLTTPLQAIRTLGMDTIETLVLKVGLFRQFRGDAAMLPLLDGLNGYSLSLGSLAGKIAEAAGGGETIARTAHCAGMLSAIGCLVFLDRRPGICGSAMEGMSPGMTVSAVEHAAFGTTHQMVGAYLLGLWGFSDEVVEAVAFAAEPSLAPARGNPILTAVHVATALGPRFPLISVGASPKVDMAYLAEARQDGNLQHWQALAEDHLRGA